jgi:hypothetical protein
VLIDGFCRELTTACRVVNDSIPMSVLIILMQKTGTTVDQKGNLHYKAEILTTIYINARSQD